MAGMGETICMGSASSRHKFSLSQPAPSRNNPWIKTPSWKKEERKHLSTAEVSHAATVTAVEQESQEKGEKLMMKAI